MRGEHDGSAVATRHGPARVGQQLLATTTEAVAHARERRVGLSADRGDGAQAHDNDQGQHHGIFDCRWAILGNKETLYFLDETVHCVLPF